jgi:hypothetical protein
LVDLLSKCSMIYKAVSVAYILDTLLMGNSNRLDKVISNVIITTSLCDTRTVLVTVKLVFSVVTVCNTITDPRLRDTVGVVRASWWQGNGNSKARHTTVTPEVTSCTPATQHYIAILYSTR